MDERTAEIIKRFQTSWIETEQFYSKLVENYPGFESLRHVIQFMNSLKQNGEDKFFRLGTSVHWLIISRSVAHGLRSDQKRIKIDAGGSTFEITLRDGNQIYRQYNVASLSDTRVTNLLRTLKDCLID